MQLSHFKLSLSKQKIKLRATKKVLQDKFLPLAGEI